MTQRKDQFNSGSERVDVVRERAATCKPGMNRINLKILIIRKARSTERPPSEPMMYSTHDMITMKASNKFIESNAYLQHWTHTRSERESENEHEFRESVVERTQQANREEVKE